MAVLNVFGALALDQSVMATTPLLKAINTTLQATPYVYVVNQGSVSASVNFPGVQNVNLANVSTPPLVQTVSITSTPVVSLLNTNVGVNNFPTVYPTQGIVNVNIANVATPPAIQNVSLTSTPIIYSYQPFPYVVQGTVAVSSLPAPGGVTNVNLANVATPPAIQAVSITSTPVVSLLNTNVGVNNFPVIYPTQGIVNVNVANVATPAPIQSVSIVNASTPLYTTVFNNATPLNVSITSTPIVYAVLVNQTAGGASSNVNVTNFPAIQPVSMGTQATPIVVISSMPPISATVTFPGIQNVNIANVSTPVAIQSVNIVNAATPLYTTVFNNATPINVALTSTPIVYAYQASTYNVNITSTPIIGNVTGTVSANVTFPGMQNVNLANPSTPPSVQSVAITSTPIIYSYQPYPYAILGSVAVTSIPATTQNVNIANVATPPVSQQVNFGGTFATPAVTAYQGNPLWNVALLSTPVVSILNQNVGVNNFPATYPTQGVVNVNVANTATPFILATPSVIAYQGNANYNVNVSNVVATPTVYAQVIGMPLSYPVKSTSINLWVAAPGSQTTPVVQATNTNIITKSYVITSSAASVVAFMATPSPLILQTPNRAGLPQSLLSTAIVGGPFYMAANSSISFAGDVDGHGLLCTVATPLYIVSCGGNIGGHLTYALV